MMSHKKEATLASVSDVWVTDSPYKESDFCHKGDRALELIFEFVKASMVFDNFGNDHSARRNFWREWEPLLSDDEQYIVRHNPLKWGMVSAVMTLLPMYGVEVRQLSSFDWTEMTTFEKEDYVSYLRSEVVEKI